MIDPGLHLIVIRECHFGVIISHAFFAHNVFSGTVHLPGNPVDVVPLRVQVFEDLSLSRTGLRLPNYMLNSSVSIFGSFNLKVVNLDSQHIVGFETFVSLQWRPLHYRPTTRFLS